MVSRIERPEVDRRRVAVTFRLVSRKLLALGSMELPRRGGSHRKWVNPATERTTVVPDWGGRDLTLGTVLASLRRPRMGWEQFRRA